ncbi:MAG: relaxase/mobilization nuclease domain-containing protein [Lachnospiraceae bacterium]
MGILVRMTKGNYTNQDAVDKVLHYISRTRDQDENQDEVLATGGAGVNYYSGTPTMINQFSYVQHVNRIEQRKGRRMYHEIFQISMEEFYILGGTGQSIDCLASALCQYYFAKGHQVVFAVHAGRQGDIHIHFAVNTINFINGKKWHDSKLNLKERESYFNSVIASYAPFRQCI